MQINILHLYPDLLNLYGDRGNICAFSKRLEWRGIECSVTEMENEINLEGCDLLYLGGGGDREEAEVFEKLSAKKNELKAYVNKGGVVFATCGGFELLGKLGIIDIEITPSEKRLIGNVILNCEIDGKVFNVAGFENHPEKVNIKENAPLGKVVLGAGNNCESGEEGVVFKNVFATHLHGPVLMKSPVLCDIILSRALKNKYENFVNLEPLDDNFEQIALEEIKKKVPQN